MNYCKNLLAIFFTEPDDERDEYVHAFSFNENILQLLLIANVSEECRHMYSIKPIKSLLHMSGIDSKNHIKHFLLETENKKYSDINKTVYGINMESDEKCEQVLLFIEETNIKYIRDNSSVVVDISENAIQIDTFYPEGILNV